MKEVTVSSLGAEFGKVLSSSAGREVLLTQNGTPAGVLISFADEDDWFDYQLEHDPRFVALIAGSRKEAKARKVVRLEELEAHLRSTGGAA